MSPKALKKELLRNLFNAIIKAESENKLQAEQYSKTEERTDYRNFLVKGNLSLVQGVIQVAV